MIQPPPNPKAEQARAEMQAYSAPLLQNPPRCTPPAPPLSDALAACLSALPPYAAYLTRYADTARVERLDYELDGRGGWCWCVTVTIDSEAEQKGQEQ